MSILIYKFLVCCRSWGSKELIDTGIEPTFISTQVGLEDFINQANKQQSLAGDAAGGNTTTVGDQQILNDLVLYNSLRVYGPTILNTVQAVSLDLGTFHIAGNTISSSTTIILNPTVTGLCDTEVIIRENLTVEGCYTHLCTTDTHIADPTPILGECAGVVTNDTWDRGWIFGYMDGVDTRHGFMGWDRDRS